MSKSKVFIGGAVFIRQYEILKEKCKIHSSSLKRLRITACQNWRNSPSVKELKVFIGGAVFI